MPPSSDSHAGGAVADTRSAVPGRSPDSYVEILVSSVLIGGSSVLALLVGLVRTKAMAMLLGPAGFGLFAMFLAIADLARSVSRDGDQRQRGPPDRRSRQRRTTGEWR